MLEVPHPSETRRTRVENAAASDGGGAVADHGARGASEQTPTASSERSSERGPERLDGEGAKKKAPKKKRPKKGPGSNPNNVRKLRIERMMSKAELARRANLSVLTIDRVEKGYGCRMDTKRKILEALGLSLGDRVRVFGEEE